MTAATDVLTLEVERPLGAALPEGWCENYALVANDPVAGIHLIMCTGCQPFDATLWHEMLQVSSADGRTFAWKSAGRQPGPGGSLIGWECEAPGRWRLRFSGYGRIVGTDLLADAPLEDGPWTRGELDLTFQAAAPPWILGEQNLASADEHSHYEQAGRITGSLTSEGRTLAFDGTGLRDHSRGPREFAGVHDHAWVDCLFPSGRCFALYRMRLPGGADGVAAAYVGSADAIEPARVSAMPLLDEDPASVHRYQIVLETAGASHVIDAEIAHPIGTTSYLTPNLMMIGAGKAPEVTQIVSDGATRFTWDGEAGWGHTQRSRAPQHRQ